MPKSKEKNNTGKKAQLTLCSGNINKPLPLNGEGFPNCLILGTFWALLISDQVVWSLERSQQIRHQETIPTRRVSSEVLCERKQRKALPQGLCNRPPARFQAGAGSQLIAECAHLRDKAVLSPPFSSFMRSRFP